MTPGKRRAELVAISRRLAEDTGALAFDAPVTCIYNPLEYARANHEEYLRRYGGRQGVTLLVGMNPGPFGMAQTGVPFGAVSWVKDWLKIEGEVTRPEREHPKRPISGLECARTEVSGDRLWGWAAERFGSPEAFFDRFFVWNYCPLCFVVESGANLTPDRLRKDRRVPLFAACDRALADVIDLIEPRAVVGIGRFATDRVRALVDERVRVGQMLHPSPASPAANRGWRATAEAQLEKLGLL
jgi:single-strand selective monofunctional uracil DNA glycosylase